MRALDLVTGSNLQILQYKCLLTLNESGARSRRSDAHETEQLNRSVSTALLPAVPCFGRVATGGWSSRTSHARGVSYTVYAIMEYGMFTTIRRANFIDFVVSRTGVLF